MEAIGSEEAEEGPGAKPGSWGAESEGLATGLSLTLSLVPAVGDSLSETSLLINGKSFSTAVTMLFVRW